MTLRQYTLNVIDPQYWDEIYDILSKKSSEQYVPDRAVKCSDIKDHSPTRGNFLLHENEVKLLKNDPRIEWIELAPEVYPDQYPKPYFASKRWNSNVKVYRELTSNGPIIPIGGNPSSTELNRTNWGVIRSGLNTNGQFWSNSTGSIGVRTSNSDYTLTGKNVDIVIHDSGVLQYHPEFLDSNGRSRVRDIVLDGPYYIDKSYFDSVIPGAKYFKTDGRVGIATTAAEEWWENSSKRSAQFSGIGTVSIPSDYTVQNTVGSGGTSHNLGSGHGTCCASLSAGNNFGLAFEANIWNMCGIGDNTALTIEQNYTLMKLFHQYKPINQSTGLKNPTLINGSWGYQAAFASGSTVTYKFRETTGTFTGNTAVTGFNVTAMKEGLVNQVSGSYRSWSSSSRSNSTDTAANEMMNVGVIYVAAAGNNNQRLGIGSADPDRLNYMSDNWFASSDPRTSFFPVGTVPCNHRDWMNPQGIGFNSIRDYHPVVCVGALDDFVNTNCSERKASHSNNGPGIDVWAPADELLAAGLPSGSYADYQRFDNSLHFDNNFNGTSAAAPMATGLIALYLESNPRASSIDVKNWLSRHGSKSVGSDLLEDTTTSETSAYWTGLYNMRGSEKRILFNPFANSSTPSISNVIISGVSFSQS